MGRAIRSPSVTTTFSGLTQGDRWAKVTVSVLQTVYWTFDEKPTWQLPEHRRRGASVEARSERASRGRLLLARPAEQIDEVLMQLEPDGVIGVAVGRGDVAVIAGLDFGKRIRKAPPIAAYARRMRRDIVDQRDRAGM